MILLLFQLSGAWRETGGSVNDGRAHRVMAGTVRDGEAQ